MSPRFILLSTLAAAVTMSLACSRPSSSGCDETNCVGCCDSTGTCQLGVHEYACGRAGGACAVCSDEQSCHAGACIEAVAAADAGRDAGMPLCNQWNCVGCCAGDSCIPYDAQRPDQCGVTGAQCQSCSDGERCSSGVCAPVPCDATTCADGCCSNTGTCIRGFEQTESQCGKAGGACSACTAQDICQSGSCKPRVCDSTTCAGCCLGTNCVPFANQSDSTCGASASACTTCGVGKKCDTGQCVRTASPDCLVISPDDHDFGSVEVGCKSPTVTFTVWNQCTFPVTINSIGLNAISPQFTVDQGASMPVTLANASETLTFSARYVPPAAGLDQAVIELHALQNGTSATYSVQLVGSAAATSQNSESYSPPSRVDVLFLIDDSGSMTAYKASVSQGLQDVMQFAQASALDYQLGLVTTDCSQGSCGRMGDSLTKRNYLTSHTQNVETEAAGLFNVGTNGAGLESVFDPIHGALTVPNITTYNAGFMRNDSALGIVAVTDFGEVPAVSDAFELAVLRSIKGASRPNWMSFSIYGPESATPPSYCAGYDGPPDQGHYAYLAANTGGAIADICAPLPSSFSKLAFGQRNQYFLRAAPDFTGPSSLSVEINGQPIPATGQGGMVFWTYDAATNSVTFDPSIAPKPLQTVTFTYNRACIP